jgi:xylulokinase
MDAKARGAFVGLTFRHDSAHLARAIMEGVSFALYQTLSLSQALAGQAERVIIAGGGAESAVWAQIQADVYGVPLQKTLLSEQTSLGAALLAGVATGIYASLQEACAQTARYGALIEPNAQRHAQYTPLFQEFLGLYPTLRPSFHALSDSVLRQGQS